MRKNHCLKSVQIRSFFWSVFSRIWTEYEDLRSNSQYSVRIRDNTDQKKLRIWTLFTQWTWLLILTLIVHQSSLIDCQLFNWPWHCVKSAQIRSFFWSLFGHISHSVMDHWSLFYVYYEEMIQLIEEQYNLFYDFQVSKKIQSI